MTKLFLEYLKMWERLTKGDLIEGWEENFADIEDYMEVAINEYIPDIIEREKGDNIELSEALSDLLELLKKIDYSEIRVCGECGRIMTEGYVVNGGCHYYCDDECLCNGLDITLIDWEDYCDDDNYWTEFE